MATYVVDKQTGNDSNTGLSTAQAWKTLKKANTAVPAGTHTVEIIEGSGPYGLEDLGYSGISSFYPAQAAGSIIAWNFNGNPLRYDVNVNDGSYKWTRSTAEGKENWFYLTNPDDTAPTRPNWDGTNILFTAPSACKINDSWSVETTNLISGFALYGRYSTDNWAWGDYDSLGFSTVYVILNSGDDPTDTGVPIYIGGPVGSVLTRGGIGNSLHIFNDAILSGAQYLASPSSAVDWNRCQFLNAGETGIFTNSSTLGQIYNAKKCVFKGCGHESYLNGKQHTMNIYGCHHEDNHVIVKLLVDVACTINFANNSSKNLLAGAIQKDKALPVLNEWNNQFHIDPDSTHAAKAIAFSTGTRYWTTTAATDLPASTDTSLATSVDPLTKDNQGRLKNTSPCIDAGAWITGVNDTGEADPWGNYVHRLPNIGADQGAGSPGSIQIVFEVAS